MSKESIEIIVPVAGRSYPLTVSPEEVDGIMAAAKNIDDSIAKLRSQFAVQDRNDLLAMTALQLSIKNREQANGRSNSVDSEANSTEDTTQLESNIENLLQRLESAMQG